MSTPEPTQAPAAPSTGPVIADVHEALDDAKTQALQAIAAIEHVDFGTVLDDAKRVIHDSIEALKTSVHDLLHGAQPNTPSVPAQDTPTA